MLRRFKPLLFECPRDDMKKDVWENISHYDAMDFDGKLYGNRSNEYFSKQKSVLKKDELIRPKFR